MVHWWTVVVLMYKQTFPVSECWHLMLTEHLALPLILSALLQIVRVLLWASLTLQHMSTIRSPFSNSLITSNFSSVLIVFRRIFTWIALCDADLCFWLILAAKANAIKEETRRAVRLYHQCNKPIHMTDGMTVTSCSASLLQKKSAAMDSLCQIVLNWKLSRKFETWYKFSSCITTKSQTKKKRNCVKWDLPVVVTTTSSSCYKWKTVIPCYNEHQNKQLFILDINLTSAFSLKELATELVV